MQTKDLLLLVVVIFLLAFKSDAQPTVNASLVATVAPAEPIYAVVNSGSSVFVGTPNSGSNGNVFAYNCNFVSLHCTLFTTLPNGQENLTYSLSGSNFGQSIAVSGTTLVVGAPFYNSNHGVVLIYDCSTTTCTFITNITGVSSSDNFGSSVDVYGSTVAVYDLNYSLVTLYQCSSTCSSGYAITIATYDLALSGVILAIASGGLGNIYQCANYTDCTRTSISSVSGHNLVSVSVSNGLVVFGDGGQSGTGSGAVYVVSCTTSVPVSCGTQFVIASPSDITFGASVSVYGKTVVASDPYTQVNGQTHVGAFFVYTCTPNNGPGSNVTCVGPSEQIIPTSPQADQELGLYGQSLDETSGVVLVGDELGNLYSVSIQNNPTPTVFTGSLVSLTGANVAVNVSETKSCRIVEGSNLFTGYPLIISNISASVCCKQLGVVYESSCYIQVCVAMNSSMNYATSDGNTCYADSVCYLQGSYDATAENIPVYDGTVLTGPHSLPAAGPTSKTVFIKKTSGAVSAAFQITPPTTTKRRRSNLAAEYGCSLKGTYTSGSCSATVCGMPSTIDDYFYDTVDNCYYNCIGST